MAKSFALLDLSKGFSYINQDLDNVHNSSEDIMEINDKKLETHLGEKISTGQISDKDIDDYVKGLDNQKIRRINERGTGFSTNGIISYLNHWDEWKNPFASGTGMYEKKSAPIIDSESFNALSPILNIGGALIGGELVGAGLEKRGRSIYDKNVKLTKRDVDIQIVDKSDKEIYKELEKDLKAKGKEIKKAKANGASAEEISNLENDYKRIQGNMNKHNPKNRETTVDYANKKGFAGSEKGMAVQARTQKTLDWYREVDPYIDRSPTRFNKSDILNSISRDSFGVDDFKWSKDYEPVLKDMKEFVAKEGDISLRELQEWRNKIQVSKNSIKGQEAKAVEQNIYDKLDRAIGDKISETLEKENPGKGLGEKVKDYGKGTEFYTSQVGKAEKELTKEVEKADTLLKRFRQIPAKVYDKVTSKPVQTKTAQGMQTIGKNIRPTTWAKRLTSIAKGGLGVQTPLEIAGLLSELPGKVGEAGRTIMDETPAGQATQLMNAPEREKMIEKDWNSMNDDERIEHLKMALDYIYDEDYPISDVAYTYYKWKGDSDGKVTPHKENGWMWYVGANGDAIPDYVLNEKEDRAIENSKMPESIYKGAYTKPGITDEEKIYLIQQRYLVDEDEAKDMLKYMDASGNYTKKSKPTQRRSSMKGTYLKQNEVDPYDSSNRPGAVSA